MGFWDRRVRETGPAQPVQRAPQPLRAPPRAPFPGQAPPRRQDWPPQPPEAPLAAYGGQEEEDEDITPETHPWAFTIGPDGRWARNPFTWRGNKNGAAKSSATCPRCHSPNYLRPEPGIQNNYADGQGVGAYGLMVNRERVMVEPRCTDCGYPKLQAGSETSMTGRIQGHAPSAEGNIPDGLGDPSARARKIFDRSSHGYVEIGG